ncbi:MAG TPA: alpha-amylase family glycosyl hydrolase, partial [Anaerolineae bacterium]|nr:alpha-amylase family glycosyl hydrolase [Anaerolineae bacterium]
YPENYAKMRYVENHDQARVMAVAGSRQQALAWTAFEAFNKGPFLIYAGQESAARHTPSLFDKDPVEWGSYELSPFLTRLMQLKKDPAQTEGQFVVTAAEPCIQAAWVKRGGSLYGVFNVAGKHGQVKAHLPDGRYADLLGGPEVEVTRGHLSAPESAAVVRCEAALQLEPFYSDLLDLNIDRD